MNKIKILIVDDHYMVRIGLANTVGLDDDLTVVGEAAHGMEALEQFRKLQPDVVLMDFQMPGLSGAETTGKLRDEFPEARVLLLSVSQREEDIWQAVQAGVMGYLLKSVEASELLTAIREVADGGTCFPPAIATKVAERRNRSDLSQREMDVLRLIIAGRSNKEISSDLEISESRVRFCVSHILSRLGVIDRTQAVVEAIQRGLINLET